MATVRRFGRLVFLPILVAVAMTSFCRAENSIVVPPGDTVDNLSQEQWSVRWWMWAGSFNDDVSPVADRTGEFCASKQQGKVWFLAGTYGTRRTVRTCKVPRGKYLFFPLINYVVMPGAKSGCEAQMATAARMTDNPFTLILDVDGTAIPGLAAHRQATRRCFDMGASRESPVSIYPSAANGYYVLLKPLSPGRHTINFGGALPSMLQAVTYTLQVE